jgi:hypothetical protein
MLWRAEKFRRKKIRQEIYMRLKQQVDAALFELYDLGVHRDCASESHEIMTEVFTWTS